MRWTVAAAATKMYIPTMPAREPGQLVTATRQTLSLTHTIWSPGCWSQMSAVSTQHAIRINDFQKTQGTKPPKNVNTEERIRVDHTAGEMGRTTHWSLIYPGDLTLFHFNRPPVVQIRRSPVPSTPDSSPCFRGPCLSTSVKTWQPRCGCGPLHDEIPSNWTSLDINSIPLVQSFNQLEFTSFPTKEKCYFLFLSSTEHSPEDPVTGAAQVHWPEADPSLLSSLLVFTSTVTLQKEFTLFSSLWYTTLDKETYSSQVSLSPRLLYTSTWGEYMTHDFTVIFPCPKQRHPSY